MTVLPPGYRARPVDPRADVPDVLQLCEAASIHDRGVVDVDERMVREAYSLPSFAPDTDSLLVRDADGRAAAIAEYYDGEQLHVAPYLFLRVLPEHRQPALLAAVLDWAARRAPANLSQAPEGARVAMHTDLEAANQPTITALEAAGWHHDRTNWTMEIDIGAGPLAEPAWPGGVSVRAADLERDARAIHAAEMDFFSDHYGFTPNPFDEWWHFRTRFFVPEPELWILVTDEADQIVGMALCSSQRPGQPDLGWISTLGVRRDWRRRGLALAILHHSFRLLSAKGKTRAGLGVDAQSLTGATRLYEKAGMRVVREGYEFELVVREGRDLRTVSLEAS